MPSSARVLMLGFFGMLGPIVYFIAVVVGGLLWSGYSQFGETISTLTSKGAPNQEILVPLFTIYNICMVLLAIGLYYGVEGKRPLWSSTFLAIAGIGGLILFWFPQDYPKVLLSHLLEQCT